MCPRFNLRIFCDLGTNIHTQDGILAPEPRIGQGQLTTFPRRIPMIPLDFQLAIKNPRKSTTVAPHPPRHSGARPNDATPGSRLKTACTRSLSCPVPFPCTIRTRRMPRVRHPARYSGTRSPTSAGLNRCKSSVPSMGHSVGLGDGLVGSGNMDVSGFGTDGVQESLNEQNTGAGACSPILPPPCAFRCAPARSAATPAECLCTCLDA